MAVHEEVAGGLPAMPAVPPFPLASRGDRLVAALMDGVIAGVFSFPVMYYEGLFSFALHQRVVVPVDLSVANWVLFLAWYFLVNGYLLLNYGQTVGKRFLMIRICDHQTGTVPAFWRLVVRRLAPSLVSLVGVVFHQPWVGVLFAYADIAFIFRADRRCIHDWIAGTSVVRASAAGR
jgi:uncharacterized RDD family membrane protein YckC